MKFIKRLLQRLKSSKRKKAVRPSPKPRGLPQGSQGPKNGKLTLAVIASALLMIILGILNIKLIRDPSIARKAFGPMLQFDYRNNARQGAPLVEGPRGKNQSPPDMTFYVSLKTQDDQTSAVKAGQEPESCVKTSERSSEQPTKPGEKKEDKSKRTVFKQKKIQEATDAPLPQADSKPKVYTVQVGAFEQPSIALEWAQKWKARGYEVILKMAARPKSGVIYYQLQLGKFNSEQQADELVKHLKSKEGITAMRLVVRD